MKKNDIIIIGAGWAALSCAYELVKKGKHVTILEGAPFAGGRARAIKFNNYVVDNGQHLLIGAYKNIFKILNELNIPIDKLFYKTNLNISTINANNKTKNYSFLKNNFKTSLHKMNFFSFKLPSIYYPLNLIIGALTITGCSIREKLNIIKFCYKIKKSNYTLKKDNNIYDFLVKNNQPLKVIKYLWEPIALASLSTNIKEGSAQIFLNILKNILKKPRFNSDLFFPKIDLSSIFPNQIIKFITQKSQGKSKVIFNSHVKTITNAAITSLTSTENLEQNNSLNTQTEKIQTNLNHKKNANDFLIFTKEQTFTAKTLIIATPPNITAKLLADFTDLNYLIMDLKKFEYENIITIYYEFDFNIASILNEVNFPMFGLIDSIGDWLFNRKISNQPNILSIVITANKQAKNLENHQLAKLIFEEIKNLATKLKTFKNYKIIKEKRAAFKCKTDINKIRPDHNTPIKNLFLIGDYTNTQYPATLEGAVISGIKCAKMIANSSERS